MPLINQVKLLYWNAQGVTNKNKVSELQYFVNNGGYDLVLLGETFLKEHHSLEMTNYAIYRCDRETHGGGVAIAVKRAISHQPIGSIALKSIENIAVQISVNGKPITVIAAYCPHYTQHFSADIRRLTDNSQSFFIMGDMNAKHPAWNCSIANTAGNKLLEEEMDGNFTMHFPDEPTHFPHSGNAPSCIDIVMTNLSDNVSNISTEGALSSDHVPITCSITGTCQMSDPSVAFDYSKANW